MAKFISLRAGIIAAGSLAAQPAWAQDGAPIVVTASRLPGPTVERDKLPVTSQTIDAATLLRDGAVDLLRSIGSDLAGVTFSEAQDNPYQPDLLYRGYAASPLGGEAQGLAVYVDGARFNQPFGDTVNWDLIPDIAIRQVTLESVSPAFGLNALGGAIAVDLKSGSDLSGVRGEASGGSFGQYRLAAEAGYSAGPWSFYLAGQTGHEDGWRDFSPSTVHQLYAALSLHQAWGTAELRLIGADTNLTGNGASPVELLAARRQSVFTWPDNSRNRYGRAELSAAIGLGHGFTLRPQGYVSAYRQRTSNGDLSDAEPCDDNDALLCLEGDGDALVTDAAGTAFASFLGDDSYAQLNRTRTDTTGYGLAVQVDGKAGIQSLAVGASWDGSHTHFDAQSLIGGFSDSRGFIDAQGEVDMASGPIRPVDVRSRRDDLGVYASDVIALGANVDISASARFNSSRVRLADQLGTALNGDHLYTRLNPAIGAVWRATPGVALYLGYAESNRAPTPAELSCADATAPCSLSAFFVADPELRQVVARTWEGGIRGKGRAGGFDVQWRLGGWRATNSNDIIFAASPARGRAYFRNVGETRRQGIEAWLGAHSRSWELALSYTFTDATYRTGFIDASPDNPAADDDGTITIRPGDRLTAIPRHSGKLTIARRLGELADLSTTGACSSGRWLLGDEANLTRPTAGYCVVDVAGTLHIGKRASLFAAVRNILDHHYATFGAFSEVDEIDLAEAPGASNPRSLSPAAPRSWNLGMRVAF